MAKAGAPVKSAQDLLLRMLGPPPDERIDPAKVAQARGHLLAGGMLAAKGLTSGELAAVIASATAPLLVVEYRHAADDGGRSGRLEFVDVLAEKLHDRLQLIAVDDDELVAEPRLTPGEMRLTGYRGPVKLRQDRIAPNQRLAGQDAVNRAQVVLRWFDEHADAAQRQTTQATDAAHVETATAGMSDGAKSVMRALMWQKMHTLRDADRAVLDELLAACRYALIVVEHDAGTQSRLFEAFMRSAEKTFHGNPLLLSVNWAENKGGGYGGAPGSVTVLLYDHGRILQRDVITDFSRQSPEQLKDRVSVYKGWKR
jgi:hypothetical protein